MDKSINPKQSDQMKMLMQRMMMAQIAAGCPHDALLSKAIAENDPKEAYQTFSYLTEIDSNEPWHEFALLEKGHALAKGNGVKKDSSEALKCFQECYKKHKSPKALLCLGDYYEQETQLPNNFQLAAEFYKKGFNAGDPMAGYRLARLIYNENIPPISGSEINDIIKYTNPGVQAGLKEPLYLFASVLLDNNHELFTTRGLPAFLAAAKQGDAFSALQLGILFKNGLYVPKDEKIAQGSFNKALAMEDSPENMLAKAYMYKNGIGVAKNTAKANTLFAEARSNISANLEFIDRLFAKDNTLDFNKITPDTPYKLPLLKSIFPVPMLQIEKPLEIEPIEIKKPLPLPAVKIDKLAPKAAAPALLPQQIVCKTVLDRCNTLSQAEDGSSLELDLIHKLIFIHDPKYKNEFVVPYEESEFNPRVNLVSLRYDDRVKQWFTKSIKALKADPETRWKISSHRFGTAVDYLMQVIGIKNPILGQVKKNQLQLMHTAESLTQKNKGHFEYTFRKEGSKNYVYHRMYRPYGEDKALKH